MWFYVNIYIYPFILWIYTTGWRNVGKRSGKQCWSGAPQYQSLSNATDCSPKSSNLNHDLVVKPHGLFGIPQRKRTPEIWVWLNSISIPMRIQRGARGKLEPACNWTLSWVHCLAWDWRWKGTPRTFKQAQRPKPSKIGVEQGLIILTWIYYIYIWL